jgi:hypothetical protein
VRTWQNFRNSTTIGSSTKRKWEIIEKKLGLTSVKVDSAPVTTLIAPEVLNESNGDDIGDVDDKEDNDQVAGSLLNGVVCENLPNYDRFTLKFRS